MTLPKIIFIDSDRRERTNESYYILTNTQQPLLATSFQGDPNSDVSYPYIPGSMIRGAIIGRYMKRHGISELDLGDDKVKNLFFDDDKSHYLNAYLESSQKNLRTLPIARSWLKGKDDELTEKKESIHIYDFADEETKYKATDNEDEEPILKSPKALGEGFCEFESGILKLYSTARRINIHNQRDRSKGRSTKDQIDLVTKKVMRKGEGEIFRYDAIDVDQTFQSVILCETDEICDEILRLLKAKDDIWLGGSQSSGYGHCKIKAMDEKCDRSDNWNEVSIPAAKRTSQDNLVITLLSNTILRDEYGQPVANPNLVKYEIEKILGIIDLPEAQPIYAGSENIGGFNRKWGLPLPQMPALSIGSVFVFKEYSLTEEQIKLLESKGIGERRVDGFGRIAVNWLSESEFQARKPKTVTLSKPQDLTDVSQKIVSDMALRMLRQNLDTLLIKELSGKKLKGDISNSQLSKLRLTVRQAILKITSIQKQSSLEERQKITTQACNSVITMLENLPSRASKQFDKVCLGSDSFKNKIEEWLNDPSSWIVNPQDLSVKIGKIEAKLIEPLSSDPIAKEYTLRLIEAVAKKATKEDKLR